MPRLDPTTLLMVNCVTTVLVGALFLLSWRQVSRLRAPGSRPLALWGAAHLAGSAASLGLALRGVIPDAVSIGLANAVVLAAYGLIWSGARAFEGRPPRPGLALAGAAVWGVLCLAPAFYGSLPARVAFASMGAAVYCAAAAAEFRRGRAEPLASRRPAILLLVTYGACYAARIPGSLLVPLPTGPNTLDSPWVTILCLASMLFSIATAFTFMGLIKERAEREQRLAAGTDPLTGVANRRAFFEDAREALAGRPQGARPPARHAQAALLLFDLDRFKGINDTHGHAVGDAVLVGFCATAAALLPPGALLGRLGGEEFACLLPGATPAVARAWAECLRGAFSALRVPELPDLRLSVSAGVVHARGTCDIEALMRRADVALYAAKGNGRDRVEVAGPEAARAA